MTYVESNHLLTSDRSIVVMPISKHLSIDAFKPATSSVGAHERKKGWKGKGRKEAMSTRQRQKR